MKQFMVSPGGACYSPRVWVCMTPAMRYGTPDETQVYDRLRSTSCWGGADKRYYRADDLSILSFEIPEKDMDGAVSFLKENGFALIGSSVRESEEFFRGFET